MKKVRIKLDQGAKLPVRAHATDAGLDLFCTQRFEICAMQHAKIRTGVHVELEEGYEAQVRGRSSLTARGIVVPTGTVDCDYTGEIGVVLFNLNADHSVFFNEGDKIAQLVISPIVTPELVEVEEIKETDRGSGGFGSTGR